MDTKVSAVSQEKHGNTDDAEYDQYLKRLQETFLANLDDGEGMLPLFTTDTAGLWDAYLANIPQDHRQHYNCNACRHFIERFGGLVLINKAGVASPAIWHGDDAPAILKPAIHALERLVRRAPVTGVFLSSAEVWGTPLTTSTIKGNWTHFSVTPPKEIVYHGVRHTAGQAMAEKREDFMNVIRALNDFTYQTLEQALSILNAEALYRSEKVLGPARWLYDLHERRNAAHGSARTNIVWLAVAKAPAGFCHPRSSMIGTLLEDIAAGLPFDDVKRKFEAKMHPLQYQRPQAAPTAGNIAQAEKIVEQLGIKESLRRRYARIEDVQALWKPAPPAEEPKGEGVFAHLKPKGAVPDPRETDIPPGTMTWEKFRRTVLPEAQEIEFCARYVRDNYAALVTAADPAAPPIIQWDTIERRNPVSLYMYSGSSTPEQWGLVTGQWHKVNAVTLRPHMWGGAEEKSDHQGSGVIFILEGAKDAMHSGLALFPEILKSELREIRATIEAFSREGTLEGEDDASACGIALDKGRNWNAIFRVRTKTGIVKYMLDRWD